MRAASRAKAHPDWLRWYDSLDRRAKVRYWWGRYGNDWDEWLCEQPSWLSGRGWLYFDSGWSRALCLLAGHDPVPDHCMRPEHDYCLTCQRQTPGEAKR